MQRRLNREDERAFFCQKSEVAHCGCAPRFGICSTTTMELQPGG